MLAFNSLLNLTMWVLGGTGGTTGIKSPKNTRDCFATEAVSSMAKLVK